MEKSLLPRLKQVYSSTIGYIWHYIRDIKVHEELLEKDLRTSFKSGTLSYITDNRYSFQYNDFTFDVSVKELNSDENSKFLTLIVKEKDLILEVIISLFLSTMDLVTLVTVEFEILKDTTLLSMSWKENRSPGVQKQSSSKNELQEESETLSKRTKDKKPKMHPFVETYIEYIKLLMGKIKSKVDSMKLNPRETILIPAPMTEIFYFISDYTQVVKLTKGTQEECEYEKRDENIRKPGVRFKIKFLTKNIVAFLEVTSCFCNRQERYAEFEFRVYDSEPYIPKIVIHYILKEVNSHLTFVELSELMLDALPYEYYRSVSLDMKKLLICLNGHFREKFSRPKSLKYSK